MDCLTDGCGRIVKHVSDIFFESVEVPRIIRK